MKRSVFSAVRRLLGRFHPLSRPAVIAARVAAWRSFADLAVDASNARLRRRLGPYPGVDRFDLDPAVAALLYRDASFPVFANAEALCAGAYAADPALVAIVVRAWLIAEEDRVMAEAGKGER